MTKCVATMSLVLAVLVSVATGQEKRVSMKDLPAPVQKTVREQTKNAKLHGLSTEVEKGKREYEAELIVDGHSKDVTMNAAGEIIEVEEQVSMNSLPQAVQGGLTKQAGKGRITKVESVTRDGNLAFYEAQVKTGTKHSEVRANPDGTPAKGGEE
ncbi:MAG: PepSY-like domain-containing protein [Blastocatellia bacterium]